MFYTIYMYVYIERESLIQHSQTKNVFTGHFSSCMMCYTESKIIKDTCKELSPIFSIKQKWHIYP